MIAAIEIYNKPVFQYRNECFVILLLNAWELLLKGMIAKDGKSVYYPKKRNQPYRTLSLTDALTKLKPLFPFGHDFVPIAENVRLLQTYRDNAIHFYNQPGFATVIYALAQTNIVNYKDLMNQAFGVDLGSEIDITILPLGLNAPIDAITFIKSQQAKRSAATEQFLAELAQAVESTEAEGSDTGRLLTIFKTTLESTKKITKADLTVGIASQESSGGPLVINKPVDPNVSHPLRQKDIAEHVGTIHPTYKPTFVIQAVVWKYDIRNRIQYCWRSSENVLTRYSWDFVTFLKSLSEGDINLALNDYLAHQKGQADKSKS